MRADKSNSALRDNTKENNAMQRGDSETKAYSDYDAQYYIVAWIALFLLIVEFIILNRQKKRLSKIKWFD